MVQTSVDTFSAPGLCINVLIISFSGGNFLRRDFSVRCYFHQSVEFPLANLRELQKRFRVFAILFSFLRSFPFPSRAHLQRQISRQPTWISIQISSLEHNSPRLLSPFQASASIGAFSLHGMNFNTNPESGLQVSTECSQPGKKSRNQIVPF